MKINSINNNVNFGRVIRMTTNTNGKFGLADINKPISDIEDVLNGRPTDAYTSSEQDKIKHFFQKTLDDYNGGNGVAIKTNDLDLFIISGKDFKQMNKQMKKEGKVGFISRIFPKKKSTKYREDAFSKALKNAEIGIPMSTPYTELSMDSSMVNSDMSYKEIQELKPRIDCFRYLSIKLNPYKKTSGHLEL